MASTYEATHEIAPIGAILQMCPECIEGKVYIKAKSVPSLELGSSQLRLL